ncbi:MAG: hypothetical protein A2284_17250 [Deltaproteobacteria bacterium RIFOXYA12_FULL_61_11]|nr:MAG: hypothetical protein A2284_17250 [Deltaproteobacteria bacterium RIFOXYA12_FULL_61_11]
MLDTVIDRVRQHREEVVATVLHRLGPTARTGKDHSPELDRARFAALLELVLGCLEHRSAEDLERHIARVVRRRFGERVAVVELLTALAVLEESLWKLVIEWSEPREHAEILGLLSVVFGLARNRLAEVWIALAEGREAPDRDFDALY